MVRIMVSQVLSGKADGHLGVAMKNRPQKRLDPSAHGVDLSASQCVSLKDRPRIGEVGLVLGGNKWDLVSQ